VTPPPTTCATAAPTASAERLLALAVIAVGSLLVLSTAGRPRVTLRGATLGDGQADVSGANALALAALAGAAAALLVRGRARNLVGALVACAGVAVAVMNLMARNDSSAFFRYAPLSAGSATVTHLTVWFWLTAVGAVLLAAGGGAVAVRGHRWPSARRDFEPPAGSRPTRRDPWKALDRGEDPTL
jgi:Tryptophan-associated transmembrane protein (Trp_oprn_chp)